MCYFVIMDLKKIGENIKRARKYAGITQEELAKRIGKSKSSVQKYEAGLTEIPGSVLEKIEEACNVSFLSAQRFAGAEKMRDSFNRVIDMDIYAASLEDGRPDILKVYNRLNEDGQDRVYNYASDLAENPKYQAAPPEDPEG